MRVLLFCLAVLTLGLASCGGFEEPTVDRIEKVDIEELTASRVVGTAEMVLKNPNPFALDLAAADLVAIADGVQLATIKQTYDTEMPANAEFKMPIRLEMDLQKLYENDPLGAISKGIQIVSKRELELNFKGTINVGKGSAKVAVPIDQVELVKF